jgi:hypothetical protein
MDDWLSGRKRPAPGSAAEAVAAALMAGAERVEVATPDGTRVVVTNPPPAATKHRRVRIFNKVAASLKAPPRPSGRASFADFIDAALDGVGDACFEYVRRETPLATKSPILRGAIVEEVVKRFYAQELGADVFDAEASTCVNGNARGKGSERYDFQTRSTNGNGVITDRRVEVKNARMAFRKSQRMWTLKFDAVKMAEHDELVLSFEGFDGLRLYKWKGGNMATQGKCTEAQGNCICVCASRSQPDPVAAHAQLVREMAERNDLVKFVAYADPGYTDLWTRTTRTASVYETVPMGTLSYKARGAMIENVVRAFMCRHHTITDAPGSSRVNGTARGKNTTTCDFLMDGERTEVKSSLLLWDKCRKGFKLQFSKIKPELHDRLLLAWMTPDGIHIFEHDGVSGMSTSGTSTKAMGKNIYMFAPGGRTGYTVPSAAERFLLKQFAWWGPRNKYVAFIAFAEGDAERLLELGKQRGAVGMDREGEESGEESGDESDGEAEMDGEEDESVDESDGGN